MVYVYYLEPKEVGLEEFTTTDQATLFIEKRLVERSDSSPEMYKVIKGEELNLRVMPQPVKIKIY